MILKCCSFDFLLVRTKTYYMCAIAKKLNTGKKMAQKRGHYMHFGPGGGQAGQAGSQSTFTYDNLAVDWY
jgi:hypothetical protein